MFSYGWLTWCMQILVRMAAMAGYTTVPNWLVTACYDPVGLDMYSCPCFCCALCVLQAGWRAADWGSDSIGRLEVPAL